MKSYYFFYYCLFVNLLFRKDYNYISHLHLSLFVFAISFSLLYNSFCTHHSLLCTFTIYFRMVIRDNSISLLSICLFILVSFLSLVSFITFLFSFIIILFVGFHVQFQIWDWEKIG